MQIPNIFINLNRYKSTERNIRISCLINVLKLCVFVNSAYAYTSKTYGVILQLLQPSFIEGESLKFSMSKSSDIL